MPTKGANEFEIAELQNDVARFSVRFDNEPAVLVLKESAATALKLAGVTAKTEVSALHDLAKQRVGSERCTGRERCCADDFSLSRLALWEGVRRMTPGLALGL